MAAACSMLRRPELMLWGGGCAPGAYMCSEGPSQVHTDTLGHFSA